MTLSRFFDSVLHEIEFGRIVQGLNLLVGLLDALQIQGQCLIKARQVLRQHTLHQMLLEEPLYAYAATNSGSPARLFDIASRLPASELTGATGHQLFEATIDLPLIRALRQRRATANQKLERAWKKGLRICMSGKEKETATAALSGRDLSNVTTIDVEGKDWSNFAAQSGMQFDLILLPDIADDLDPSALFSMVAQLWHLVSPTGTAILSAFNPGHLGSGWRQVCLDWNPKKYSASALERAAFDAGFSAHTYSDESNCIIWAELRPDQFLFAGESKNHAS